MSLQHVSRRPEVVLEERRLRVVITGSTKGLGRALAAQFVQNGHDVLVNSRNKRSLTNIKEEFDDAGSVYTVVADVSKYTGNLLLYQTAIREMGGVDVWINNAGTNGYKRGLASELRPEEINAIVSTNILGTMYGSQMAVRAMRDNAQGGLILNLEGSGLNAPSVPGYAVYESTKRAIGHFSDCLRSEVRDLKLNVCTLSPGLLKTDMTNTDDSTRRAVAMLGSRPEVVAADMYKKICRHGGSARRLVYLTPVRVVCVLMKNSLIHARTMITRPFRRCSQ